MSDCCCDRCQSPEGVALCPRCGSRGKAVHAVTVESMLVGDAKSRFDRHSKHFFCRQADCPVVYFADQRVFMKQEIRLPVFQKEPGNRSVPVCYCFGFTSADIQREIEATGKSTVGEEITRRIKAGECECETKNPQGSCCLGNVRAVVKETRRSRTTSYPAG